ncbi:MAG: hypothetical protein IIX12_07130 [Alistipes sp.]|nr:hypothetical protein [Alistipes sp.]MBR0331352.1 hypothetical protein [Alistipes sp.]
MGILALIFGLLSGCFLSVLVGLLGAQRNIGFGLSFLISLIFTPIVGLIFVLLSDPLPGGSSNGLGCIGNTLGCLGLLFLLGFVLLLVTGGAALAAL